MTLYGRIDRARRGGHVERYHTHLKLRRENVAEHSWSVALMCRLVWRSLHEDEEPRGELLAAALLHDLGEYDVGDMPAWVKRQNLEMGKWLKDQEAKSLEAVDLFPPDISFEELQLLEMCDKMDVLFWAVDQRRLGNVDADLMFARNYYVNLGKAEKLKEEGLKEMADIFLILISTVLNEYRDLSPKIAYEMNQVNNRRDYFSQLGATVT